MEGSSMNDFLRKLGFPLRPSFRIDSRETLAKAAESFGILPFFPNNIKGLSVEEMCLPGMLFGGNYDEGCWEWKGPVIRRRTTAYGKFFKRKAGFVSLDLLPYFLKYRKTAYPVKEGGMEEMLLEIIRENDSLSSTELKGLIFSEYKRENWDDLPEISTQGDKVNSKKGRKSLEGPLQRLQMGGWIIISDFEYKLTKRGERYGWGVARYSTPELTFLDKMEEINLSSKESFDFLVKEMKRRWQSGSKKSFEQLLK